MDTFFLYLHIAAGFTALAIGLVAMFAPKGQALHNKSGLVYFWAMVLVAITSTIISLRSNPINLFLLVTGIFSFYLILTGYRATIIKNKAPQFVDKLATAIMLCTALAMLSLAAYDWFNGNGRLTIILGIFGSIGGVLAIADLLVYRNGLDHPREWLLRHLGRMLGAYIATFTAFAVTNLTAWLAPILLWTLPPLFGTVAITLATRYYRKVYNVPTKKQQKEALLP
jgi:hypothetical protein